jgi:clan AA aspartic protease
VELVGSVRDSVPLGTFDFLGRSLEACVDTGFNGALLIPRSLAEDLRLDYLFDVVIETATGQRAPVSAYRAQITWLGRPRTIDVLTTDGNFALLGMKVLSDARLELEPSKGLLRISPA